MPTPRRPDRAGAEFVGKARQLRNRLTAGDAAAVEAVPRIIEPLQRRLKHHPVQRTGTLRQVERQRRQQLAGAARLDLSIEAGRRTLRTEELRVGAVGYHHPNWEADACEPGLVLGRWVLQVQPGHLSFAAQLMIQLGLHCVARRLQRGRGGEAAVMQDLVDLALAAPTAPIPGRSISIPANDGCWLGYVVLARFRADSAAPVPLVILRTFVSSDMMPLRIEHREAAPCSME